MPRLPFRSDGSEPAGRAKVFVIVTSAAGAAALTAVHPEIALPLNVALTVLEIFYVVVRDSKPPAPDGDGD